MEIFKYIYKKSLSYTNEIVIFIGQMFNSRDIKQCSSPSSGIIRNHCLHCAFQIPLNSGEQWLFLHISRDLRSSSSITIWVLSCRLLPPVYLYPLSQDRWIVMLQEAFESSVRVSQFWMTEKSTVAFKKYVICLSPKSIQIKAKINKWDLSNLQAVAKKQH